MKQKLIILNLLLLYLVFSGCKKLVEIDGPLTSVSSKNVYNNDATAIGAITFLYVNLSSADMKGMADLTSLSCVGGVSADELTYYSAAGNTALAAYSQNTLTSLNTTFANYWGVTYMRLYAVNAALEGLNASTGLSPAVKQQLTGEARFMRAFYYFYLVNLYGDVPLVLSTDYQVNALITKSPAAQVYGQIIADLKEAEMLLSDKYVKGDGMSTYPAGTEERVRPTKWAAIALLARAYLYTNNNWANAEAQASLVIANTSEYSIVPLDQVFLKNSSEAIWQLQPVNLNSNTEDANVFVLPVAGPGGYNPAYLNDDLVKAFDAADLRKTSWIGTLIANGTLYSFPYKYKVIYSNVTGAPVNEYSTVIRLAEQFLIRAEARAQQHNLDGAIADVDVIRKRAGLPLIKDINPGIGQQDLITEILKQKRLELFTEWGHRWLDLKRTGKIDEVMSIVTPKKSQGGAWKSYQQYYPIPLDELKRNPNLKQINGY